jgi:hypothetical protein
VSFPATGSRLLSVLCRSVFPHTKDTFAGKRGHHITWTKLLSDRTCICQYCKFLYFSCELSLLRQLKYVAWFSLPTWARSERFCLPLSPILLLSVSPLYPFRHEKDGMRERKRERERERLECTGSACVLQPVVRIWLRAFSVTNQNICVGGTEDRQQQRPGLSDGHRS